MYRTHDAVRKELHRLSHEFFGIVGLAGVYGPTMPIYNRCKGKGWLTARYLLKHMELPVRREGWEILLDTFGLSYPPNREVQYVLDRAKHTHIKTPCTDDDEYPELSGYWTETSIDTQQEDGTWIRRTRRTFHVR